MKCNLHNYFMAVDDKNSLENLKTSNKKAKKILNASKNVKYIYAKVNIIETIQKRINIQQKVL